MLLAIPFSTFAQTPDGEPPSYESVCDEETGAAFGLCNAYCEAMDCDSAEPAASAEACAKVGLRFENITGREPPCDVPDLVCPCWTQAELDSLPYPEPGEGNCWIDHDGSQTVNRDEWRFTTGEGRTIVVATIEVNGILNQTCNFYDPDGLGTRFTEVPDYATWLFCEEQVYQSGRDRGFACFP